MESVALFRNMNLGHAGSPSRDTLLQAFTDAGAFSARSFQTNGTVIFTAAHPNETAQRARELLPGDYNDAVFVRQASRITQIVSEFPAPTAESNHYREMVVFYNNPSPGSAPADAITRDGLVEVLRLEDDAAFGLIWKPKNTAGNITAFIERRLDTIGTSRTLGTLRRLQRTLTG